MGYRARKMARTPKPTNTAKPEKALPSRRLAEPYEALRDASDAILARTGRRPAVFLANLGPVAVHNARSTFAANAFAAAEEGVQYG